MANETGIRIGATRELEVLGDIETLRVEPGDTIVLKMQRYLKQNEARWLQESLRQMFPGNRSIILQEGEIDKQMKTEILDKAYLEYSRLTTARNWRELEAYHTAVDITAILKTVIIERGDLSAVPELSEALEKSRDIVKTLTP